MPAFEYVRRDLIGNLQVPEDEDMTSYERELGSLTAKVEQMEREIGLMRSDVRAIRDTITQAKGGWKALVVVSGISGTIGAVATKLVPYFLAISR